MHGPMRAIGVWAHNNVSTGTQSGESEETPWSFHINVFKCWNTFQCLTGTQNVTYCNFNNEKLGKSVCQHKHLNGTKYVLNKG